ncbi:DUF3160 domain-containing protein [Coleofasciculus sp.]|uniref:DUF3160 domain-containing protein n=1 Tax=Coleofasciculus sp. TaxID=3100458 RepID=UPI003A273083
MYKTIPIDKTLNSAKTTTLAQSQNTTPTPNYPSAFTQALKEIGQISPLDFAQRYPHNAQYLPQLTWNPTTAQFWDQFNIDPEKHNSNPKRTTWRLDDFRLNDAERAIFQKNGFVVSERLGAESFATLFYRIYSNDLPVFVSTDALLHAWHRSFDAMLAELEEDYLAASLDEILTGMAAQLSNAQNQYGQGILQSSLLDADYFLAVARSLLAGNPVKTVLNQDTRVAETLKAIETEQRQNFSLFGRQRVMDLSQFKPRGHYENSPALQNYFRAMMWCGRVDLRIAGNPQEASPRELGAAIVLHDLLKQANKFEQWQQFDQMLQTFVGKTDSLTFAQLDQLLTDTFIQSPADVKDLSTLEQLQVEISTRPLGVQNIRSHDYASPPEGASIPLPRSFTVLGQKFVLDSWVTTKIVFDEIRWNGEKVQRRIPTSLDVAFAALGNNQVVPELVIRMTNSQGHKFRDGLNYQHNLAAVKTVVDEQNPAVWNESIYINWLATLRELSAPTTDEKYPEAMRTSAWAMKTLNTQLASWTQLRHDTILYAKQSYSIRVSCYYPAGFVEPRPTFWSRFETMARRAANLIEKTPFPKDGQYLQQRQSSFLTNFAHKLGILKQISEKELAQEELTETETQFLKNIVEIETDYVGTKQYNGWYPRLFYKEPEDSDKWDAIVADVHTNVPDPMIGDPGSVLHQGVGNVDLMMIAVDNGEDKMVYAGPTLSHYEFEMPGVSRKSDSEWQRDIKQANLPPRPDWTSDYLVPAASR